MIERGRAFRRHQWQRAKARAVRLVRLLGLALNPPRLALAYAVDRRPCSCRMCGSPRCYYGERPRI